MKWVAAAGMWSHFLSEERTDDLDVHLNGARAAEDAGEHRDALFGEGVREVLDVAATL